MSEQTPEEYDEIEEEFGIEGLEEMEEEGEKEEEVEENVAALPPQKKKTVWNAVGIIFLILIGLIGLFYYAAIWLPQHRAQQMARQAVEDIAQTEIAVNEPESAIAFTPTRIITELSSIATEGVEVAAAHTKVFEPTPVYAMQTPTAALKEEEDLDPIRTATVAALLTEAAIIAQPSENPQETAVNAIPVTSIAQLPTELAEPSATALPKTGWMEEAGLPSMGILAVGLILLIVIVRAIRTSRSAP